jgi:hypothetical protein
MLNGARQRRKANPKKEIHQERRNAVVWCGIEAQDQAIHTL